MGKHFDLADFRRDLSQMARQARATLPGALNRASGVLASRIASNAPVLSGKTRASVRVLPVKATERRLSQTVAVGDKSRDGAPVGSIEFGDVDEAPNPFIRRAIAQTDGEMERIIEDGFPD